MAFTELGPIDAVLLSHDHHEDNLDRAGRALISQMGTIVTTQAGARRLGGGARGLAPWSTTVLESDGSRPVKITATPCRHGPPGSGPVVGQVTGFSLTWEGQSHGTLWISGDTVLYAGVREVARRIGVSVAVLNLGGVTFPWLSGPLCYTLNSDEAIELCRELNPLSIIPLHFEGWKHFREPRQTAIQKFAASPFRDRVHWLARGEKIEIESETALAHSGLCSRRASLSGSRGAWRRFGRMLLPLAIRFCYQNGQQAPAFRRSHFCI